MKQTKTSSFPAPSVSDNGGGGGTATGNESFVTVNDDTATLPNSRQITAGSDISVVDGGAGNPITIDNDAPENTSVANVGAGAGDVYRDMTGDQINLKTIKAGDGIDVTNNTDDVEISCIAESHVDFFIPAGNFLPEDNNPAPLTWDVQSTGFSGKTGKFVPGSISAMTAFHVQRVGEISGYPNSVANAEIHGYMDNASTNDVSLSLGFAGGATPAYQVNSAPTYATLALPGDGNLNVMRFNFQFTSAVLPYFASEFGQWWVRRNVDTNPGNFYFVGILVYYTKVLYV